MCPFRLIAVGMSLTGDKRYARMERHMTALERVRERVMDRVGPAIAFIAILAMVAPSGVEAGSANYERTYSPRIIAVTGEVRSFYMEFRARDEVGGLGHSYVTLGTIDALGVARETVVAGFLPKSADDDYWSQIGIPVAGLVGVARSDFIRRPNARFRIAIGKAKYYRIVSKIHGLRATWTTYELVVRNCNSFVSQIADTAGLRVPMVTAQLPVRFVAELRALNSH